MTKRILVENKTKGKVQIIFGIFVIIMGAFFLIKSVAAGIILMFIGVIVYAVGKFQYWYWNE